MDSVVGKASLRLLVAEDSEDDFEILLRELRKGGFDVTAERVATADKLRAALDRGWDMIVSDWMIPGFGGEQVLGIVRERTPETPCIVLSGTPGEEAAVAALRAGALDFLSKDRPRRIVPAVERALREAASQRDKRRTEDELRMSEARYRAGFDVAPEILLTYDLETYKFVDANARALQFFDWTLDQLLERGLGGFSPSIQPDGRDSREAAASYVEEARAGNVVTFEWTYMIRGGLVPAEATFVPMPTQHGKLARVSIMDLRERHRAEELRHKAAELELQNRRIQEASRLKSEFLANMSHELRTPLNAIIGFAELLYDGAVDPASGEHHEFLGDILTSGRHLLQLINDVLDLAKVEAGKLEFRPEDVRLDRLVAEVSAVLKTVAANKRLRLEVDVDPSIVDAHLDPARFKQVAYNYLSNALKFTPDGGRVVLRIRPEHTDKFRIEVVDTGVGIAPNDLEKLFVEFQQLEGGSTKRHQGTGLGLALTKRLVEAQGGSVGVSSTLGEGSTFHAVLPRRIEISVEPVRLPPASKSSQTVLVVEDDARDQASIVDALAKAGYAVEVATTGQEALRRWKDRRFDAATVDLLLPDMSGVELLAAIGKSDVPVIVVTVIPDPKVVAGYAVHDVLSKPIDRDDLLASLARAGLTGGPHAR